MGRRTRQVIVEISQNCRKIKYDPTFVKLK